MGIDFDTDSFVTNEMFCSMDENFKDREVRIKTIEIFARFQNEQSEAVNYSISYDLSYVYKSDLELYSMIRESLEEPLDDDDKVFLQPFESEEVQKALAEIREEGRVATNLIREVFEDAIEDMREEGMNNLCSLNVIVTYADKSNPSADLTYAWGIQPVLRKAAG